MRQTIRIGVLAMMATGMLLAASGALRAADVDTPTTTEIIKTLKMRGISIIPPQQGGDSGVVQTDVEGQGEGENDGQDGTPPTPEPAPVEPPTLNVRVLFEFASSSIAPEAGALLDNIGNAFISEDLMAYKFLIAGHTDAVGSSAYNLGLSKRRAEAVKMYLIDRFDIAPDRLVTVGYGEDRLLKPNDPENAVNRRVQITNLGLME